jgi:hypothetical protein
LCETLDHLIGNFTCRIDFIGIDRLAQEAAQPFQKRIALIAVLRPLRRKRMQRIPMDASHEEPANESTFGGCGLAR